MLPGLLFGIPTVEGTVGTGPDQQCGTDNSDLEGVQLDPESTEVYVRADSSLQV